jgi:hypothetical protein
MCQGTLTLGLLSAVWRSAFRREANGGEPTPKRTIYR